MRVGFVGCGNQGLPMAHRLLAAGFPLNVWARRPGALDSFAGTTARIASDLATVGRESDVVGVCVYDAGDVREVVLGPDGLAPSMARGGVVMVHSTVAPADVVGLAERLEPLGIEVVDAPVSGGPAAAAEGTLTVALGGRTETLDRVAPVVAAYAGAPVRLGGLGAGQRAKLLNNALVNAQIRLASDALALGDGLGLDPEALATVLRTGTGRSFGLEVVLGGRTVEVLARSKSRVTITKDVDLIRAEVGDGPADGLVSVATRLCRSMELEVSR